METTYNVKKTTAQSYGYIIIAVFLWATIEIVMQIIKDDTSAIIINFFRFSIGGVTLLGYSLSIHNVGSLKTFLIRFPKYYLPAAFFGLTFGMLLFSIGTLKTEAFMAATIISSNPIIISFFMILFQGEKRNPGKIGGILLGFLGILIIITEFQFAAFLDSEYFVGNLLVFLGTVLWSLDLIIGKVLFNKSKTHPEAFQASSLDFNTTTFLITALLMVPFLFLPGEWTRLASQSLTTWGALIYLGIFPTGLAYLFFFKGIHQMEVSRGANLFYLKPIFVVILSALILQAQPSIFFFLGLGVEIIALFLISKY